MTFQTFSRLFLWRVWELVKISQAASSLLMLMRASSNCCSVNGPVGGRSLGSFKKAMLAGQAREAARKARDLLRNRKDALGGGGMPGMTVGSHAVKATGMIYRYRPTEAYGAVGKLAAPWIGDPTTTTYAASADGPTGRLTGILEVSEIVDGGCRRQ